MEINPIDQKIGANIARLRGNLSQKELGVKMGWAQGTVSAIEKGKRSLSLREAMSLSDMLGVSVTALLASDTVSNLRSEILKDAHKLADLGESVRQQLALLINTYDNFMKPYAAIAPETVQALSDEIERVAELVEDTDPYDIISNAFREAGYTSPDNPHFIDYNRIYKIHGIGFAVGDNGAFLNNPDIGREDHDLYEVLKYRLLGSELTFDPDTSELDG